MVHFISAISQCNIQVLTSHLTEPAESWGSPVTLIILHYTSWASVSRDPVLSLYNVQLTSSNLIIATS